MQPATRHATNNSMFPLPPFVASSSAYARAAFRPWPVCAPMAHNSTFATFTPSFRPLSTQVAQTACPGHSVWRFTFGDVLRATHRSIGRRTHGGRGFGGSNGPRGPGGPWQYFKDRINAIPSTYIFWGIVGLNGAVFVTWNLAWAKYVSALLCMPHSHRQWSHRSIFVAKHRRPIFLRLDDA